MNDFSRQLHSIIMTVEPKLSQMNHDNAGVKFTPYKWSKKEILGHLIDSAANNHQRFVRAVNNGAVTFPTYDQNEWVRIQQYNERPWQTLVSLWSSYNNHLIHIIDCIPEEAESSLCNTGKENPVPLHTVINDYLRHLQHHLKEILD